jgi:hypothetical protein
MNISMICIQIEFSGTELNIILHSCGIVVLEEEKKKCVAYPQLSMNPPSTRIKIYFTRISLWLELKTTDCPCPYHVSIKTLNLSRNWKKKLHIMNTIFFHWLRSQKVQNICTQFMLFILLLCWWITWVIALNFKFQSSDLYLWLQSSGVCVREAH